MQAQIPPVVARFFRGHSLHWAFDNVRGHEEHPIIVADFHPDRGWRRYPIRKRVSVAWVRRHLAPLGVTHLALSNGHITADFSVAEVFSRKRVNS